MKSRIKSNPISNSVDGVNFEHSVQAFFVVQMMLGGMVPRMGDCRITNVILQSDRYGHETDDCKIILKNNTGEEKNLLVQIKRNFKLGKKNNEFTKTIRDAWMDFNDKQKFNKALDKIMLVAGGLDRNGDGLKSMLTHIQSSYASSSQFWENYNNNLTGRSKCELEGFKRLLDKLKEVNNGTELDESTVFDFCKSFFIIKSDMHEGNFYNGDINITLIHSMLASKKWNNGANPKDVWAKLYLYISGLNKDQVNLCVDKPLDELKGIFEESDAVYLQNEISNINVSGSDLKSEVAEKKIKTDYRRELALFCLIGGYDSANPNDKKIITRVFDENYDTLQGKIQSTHNSDVEILKLENTIWKVVDPKSTMSKISNYIYDSDIENFKAVYLEVLREIDPALDLPMDKRYMASIYGKKRMYSQPLRSGVANGMAMLANNQEMFKNCSVLKIDEASSLVVNRLLDDNHNPKMWASIEEEASLIAQTAPNEFLKILHKTLLISKNNPFKLLSKDVNEDVFFEKDYMAGLRRALADLAWDRTTFFDSCLVLGKLSTYESARSEKNNRALEIILETILPWKPQTLASVESRYRLVDEIIKRHKKNGRILLKNLLPNVTQVSVERQIPKWNNNFSSDDLANRLVRAEEFWKQSSHYACLFVKTAESTEEIIDVIRSSEHITDDAFDALIEKINKKIGKINKKDQRSMWSGLLDEVNNMNRLNEDKDDLFRGRTQKFQKIISKIEPKENIEKFSYLFNKYDHELMYGPDWSLDREKLRQKREKALLTILKLDSTKKLYELVEMVKFPHIVGSVLSGIEDPAIDNKILPGFISEHGFSREFIRAFVYGRYYHYGQSTGWIFRAGFNDWNDDQKTLVLTFLPFKQDTWDLLNTQKKDVIKKYWKEVNDFRSMYEEGYSEYAVGELLKAKRPLASVECIYWSLLTKENTNNKDKINNNQCIEALIKSANSTENNSMINRLHNEILKIFDYLYKNSNFINTNLWEAEWSYLPLFRKRVNSAQPLALVHLIANDAKFFCDLVQMTYKSNNSPAKEYKKLPNQLQNNLLRVLSFNDFSIMPGLDQNMKFDKNKFKSWIKETEIECAKSGHLAIAQSIIGGYLINAPKDQSGLWINESVAKVLDRNDSVEMRLGYNRAIYNSRGIHGVDFTGSEEARLRDLWKERAVKVEEKGFSNFARSLRSLADVFEHERKRVKEKGKHI